MPWRGAEFVGDYPSLGPNVEEWAREYLSVPDGPFAGEKLELTEEQFRLLCQWYQLDDRGKFIYRRGCKRAPQGWGKSPFLAAIALAELAGPTRFDGWDSDGEPVGVRPVAPWVQVAAVSEDQTDNTFAAAYAMASESALVDDLLDIGLTRMFLKGETGRLEPVTASAGSRLGQRLTFAVLDETHLWTRRNGGQKLAATIRRNASKMGGRTFESTNAHLVGEDSVAEKSLKAARNGAPGLLYEASEPSTGVDDLSDRPAVLVALNEVYGDSVRWIQTDRLADEIADPGTDESDARRFYLNQLRSGGSCPFDISLWEQLAAPRTLEPGTRIGLGFDGSISDDTTALYGCTVEGYVFRVAVWERPAHLVREDDWSVPRHEVHDKLAETFELYDVGRMFADPPKWWTEIEQWSDLYRIPGATAEDRERVISLETNSARRFAPPCDRFATEIRQQVLSHDGDETLTHHLAACAKKSVRLADDETDGRSPFVIVKADARKIDCAVGAILAVQAARTMPEQAPPSEPFLLRG